MEMNLLFFDQKMSRKAVTLKIHQVCFVQQTPLSASTLPQNLITRYI